MYRELELNKGKTTTVDTDRYAWLLQWRWYCFGNYAGRHRLAADGPGAATIYMHNALMLPPDGLTVDHINREKLDNRIDNLRLVTWAENMQNIESHRGSSSQYRGVSRRPCGRYWKVRIGGDYVGDFKDEVAAALAWDTEADKRGWLGPRNFG